jgi:hypothetical protein
MPCEPVPPRPTRPPPRVGSLALGRALGAARRLAMGAAGGAFLFARARALAARLGGALAILFFLSESSLRLTGNFVEVFGANGLGDLRCLRGVFRGGFPLLNAARNSEEFLLRRSCFVTANGPDRFIRHKDLGQLEVVGRLLVAV